MKISRGDMPILSKKTFSCVPHVTGLQHVKNRSTESPLGHMHAHSRSRALRAQSCSAGTSSSSTTKEMGTCRSQPTTVVLAMCTMSLYVSGVGGYNEIVTWFPAVQETFPFPGT